MPATVGAGYAGDPATAGKILAIWFSPMNRLLQRAARRLFFGFAFDSVCRCVDRLSPLLLHRDHRA
jgi:hypothetical protein